MGYLVQKSSIVARLFFSQDVFVVQLFFLGNGAGVRQLSRERAVDMLNILNHRSRLCESHELAGYSSPVVGSVLPWLFFLIQLTCTRHLSESL